MDARSWIKVPEHQCGPSSDACDGVCVDYAHGCRLLVEIDAALAALAPSRDGREGNGNG